MRRWFQAVSIGIAFLVFVSLPGGFRAQAQGEGGIIPPGTFGKADPPGDSTAHFSTNRQDEPWVALNPNNAQNLAMGFNDWSGNSCTGSPDPTNTTPSDCRATPGVSLSGFVRSSNGGSSYDCRGRLELAAAGAGAGSFAFGDPSVAFGRQNVVYYGTIGFPGTSASDLTNADFFMAKSTDGGCTYTTARNVSNNVRFDDKDAVTADFNTNSPCVDNVYGAWTEFGKNGNPNPDKIMFARSTDGGLTFDIKQLSPASKFRSGVAVRTGRDGTVYAVWLDTRKGAELTMAISGNCGKTFKRNITVASVNPVSGPYPGASFRVNSFPALATDPSDENTLYAAWADRTNNHTKILVAKSSTKGQTWSDPVVAGDVTLFASSGVPASAFFPALDVDPAGNVNLAFLALEDCLQKTPACTAPGKDVAHYAMFVRRSKNSPPGTAGATWIDPLFGSGFGKCCSGDDPDASSTEDLKSQFLGDYISAISKPVPNGKRRLLVAWTNSSSASTCDAVDAYRAGTGPKPNVIGQCPLSFGNTDILLTPAGVAYTP